MATRKSLIISKNYASTDFYSTWLHDMFFDDVNFQESVTCDNYAKDGGPEVVWLSCSFYHDSLRT